MQPPGSDTFTLILASPDLLSVTGSVCAATAAPDGLLQITAAATASTPSGVPLNSPVEVSFNTSPLTSTSSRPSAFNSALPDFSFQILPQEPTSPIAVLSAGQATSGPSNSPANTTFARHRKSAVTPHPATSLV